MVPYLSRIEGPPPKKAAITYCRVAENADEMKDERVTERKRGSSGKSKK